MSLLPKPVSHFHQEERGGFSLSNGREVIGPWGSHSPFSSRNVLGRKTAGWGYHSHLTTNKSKGPGCSVSEQPRSWASPSSVISCLCLALFLGGTLFWGDYLLPYKAGFSSAFLHCARKGSWLLLSQPPTCFCFPSPHPALALSGPTLHLLSQPPPCSCSPSLQPALALPAPTLLLFSQPPTLLLLSQPPPCSCSPSPSPPYVAVSELYASLFIFFCKVRSLGK